MDDDGAGSRELLMLVDSVEGGQSAVDNHLELQLLDVDAGRAVAYLVKDQLGELVRESLEEGDHIGDQVPGYCLPGLFGVVFDRIQEDCVAFDSHQPEWKGDLLKKRRDQLPDDHLAVGDLFLVGEYELRVAGHVRDTEHRLSFDVVQ